MVRSREDKLLNSHPSCCTRGTSMKGDAVDAKKNSALLYSYPFAAALSIAFYIIFGEHLSAKIDPFVISSLVTFFPGFYC